MHYRLILLICVWYGLTCWSNCSATVMGYGFTGTLSHSTSTFYGVSTPTGTPITGQFDIDTQVAGVNPPGNPNVAMYGHTISDGVKFAVGSLDIRASEYTVTVSNNIPIAVGVLGDVINVRWVSNAVPALAPIKVNGAVTTSGMFSINLVGNQNLFSGTSLPDNLNLSSFISTLSFLADTPNGSINLFNMNSLTAEEVDLELPALPEPNSFLSVFLLFLLGQLSFPSRLAPSSAVQT